ncbi:MAG: hypothetical protein JW982_10840 [Spirochaetes bacterium]|nr:hypothetical protein [Spirochaetota bacterium]
MKNEMQLVELFNNTDYKSLTFASFFDNDFISKSAIITIDSENQLIDFSLTSENHGVLRWVNGEGIIECGSWDSMEEGSASLPIDELLAEDVLRDLPDEDLKVYLKRALKTKTFTEVLDIDFD